MQARAPARPPPAQRTCRRRALVLAASSGTPILSDPPPPQAQQKPQQPPQLRQLYPFASPEGSSASPGGRQHSAPPPLLAGTLPAAAAAGDEDGADDNDDPSHCFYFEVRGNPCGLPALVLHGGPGAGSYPSHARFFDPDRYCVVLFDQRGCGRSSPLGALRGNTASAIIRDTERLRAHLGAPAWACVLGGSWGSALGLKYALDHPKSVRALVLRAVCTMRPREEIGWLYRGGSGGASGAGPMLRPEAWRAFLAHVGMTPEGVATGDEDPLPAYYERLLSDDLARRDAAASAWMAYEWAVYCTRAEDEPLLAAAAAATAAADEPPAPPLPPPPADLLLERGLAFAGVVAAAGALPTRADNTAAQALLLCHYSLHGGFVNGGGDDDDSSLLERLSAAAASGRLDGVSCGAFHGASDAVCPPRNARDLRAAWPGARVDCLPGGVGHSMYDPALVDAVVRATDAAADRAAAPAAEGPPPPLRARRLSALIEEERRRRDADVALAAAALTRA